MSSDITWLIFDPCKKCKFEYIKGCQSIFSGRPRYFCPSCGTDPEEEEEDEDEEEEGSE